MNTLDFFRVRRDIPEKEQRAIKARVLLDMHSVLEWKKLLVGVRNEQFIDLLDAIRLDFHSRGADFKDFPNELVEMLKELQNRIFEDTDQQESKK